MLYIWFLCALSPTFIIAEVTRFDYSEDLSQKMSRRMLPRSDVRRR